jgi:hypothetical protein
MIKYHYNFLIDLKQQLQCWHERQWLKEHNIVVFPFNLWETIKLFFKRPQIDLPRNEDIDCYWVSGGNWGSYDLPNKIYICPRQITSKRIKEIIKHEITHLKCEEIVQQKNMTHTEKEAYVISKEEK